MGAALTRSTMREPALRPPGAAAASAHCTPGFDIAANPATIGALMRGADAGTRERLATALQSRHGNAAVQRLLAPAGGLLVQRWAVGLPRSTSDGARVVNYLNANSPHRASGGWAKTSARFTWGGSPAYTASEDGVITATVSAPTVTKSVSVDMPSWSPTNAAMSKAWGAMTGTLRAHEAEHERIAREWGVTLTTRLAALSVTVTNRSIAAFNAAVQAEWNTWLAEHQADQSAIDPFTATLNYSGGEAKVEAEEAPGVEGETGTTEGE
jgi:predicted secreted Zn-dependent protease